MAGSTTGPDSSSQLPRGSTRIVTIEGSGRQVQNVQQCSTQTSYENRTMGYDVVYEYAGREYSTQMPYDPGPTIRVQVTPLGADERSPDTAGYGSPDRWSRPA